MKIFSILFFALMLNISYAADEDLMDEDIYTSTQTYENNNGEESQIISSESEEDLAGFVEDYIKKDISLKGAFFIEDKKSKKILKLTYSKIKKTDLASDVKKVTAEFKDNSKIYEIDFYVSGLWGNLDITKIVLKSEIPIQSKREKTAKKEK